MFRTAVQRLYKQGEPATRGEGTCFYTKRNGDNPNTHCAVALLFNKKQRKRLIEGSDASTTIKRAGYKDMFTTDAFCLVKAVQINLHDQYMGDTKDFKAWLITRALKFANKYNLRSTFIANLEKQHG
jgi:hypothetical protein